ncbi:MAG: deoxyribose-phosphate aldolase [Oscillospiraceae bacterium]|nr:deoxyribose-phosphate aldolase [Oscillospiraceae bacterium]
MTKLELAQKIDHTLLKPDATAEQIKKLCAEAVEHRFCSVCVNSGRAALAKKCISGSGVKLCVVVGFPLGCSVTKAAEAAAMAELGADEIDMVLDVGRAKDGDWGAVEADIRAVRSACSKQVLKVILETCLLTETEIIWACQAAKNAGADFVKTSTGFSSGGAKAEDVALMKQAAGGLRVKASGGIHTFQEAMTMIDAGADRIGASAGIAILSGLEEAQ